MKPKFFSDQLLFRDWLEKHHQKEKELLVGFYKVHTKLPSLTWSEAVDQALCFGWIDGTRKSLDKDSYTIRFTPRRPNSIWSAINIAKVQKLSQEGLMTEAGLEAFNKRKEDRSKVYSHENANIQLSDNYEKIFKSEKLAWDFFVKQTPSYRKSVVHWIMSAKQEKTRLLRLQKAMKVSINLEKIKTF